jgi:hypothetical protein
VILVSKHRTVVPSLQPQIHRIIRVSRPPRAKNGQADARHQDDWRDLRCGDERSGAIFIRRRVLCFI